MQNYNVIQYSIETYLIPYVCFFILSSSWLLNFNSLYLILLYMYIFYVYIFYTALFITYIIQYFAIHKKLEILM